MLNHKIQRGLWNLPWEFSKDTRASRRSTFRAASRHGFGHHKFYHFKVSQDEITYFRISETWQKHATPCFRYVYVLRKRENSSLRDWVTFPERKCRVTFPSNLSQQISAVVRFRHVSANGFAVLCYIYQNTNARWFFEQQRILTFKPVGDELRLQS